MLLLGAAAARADVVSDDVAACEKLEVGQSCRDRRSEGTCQPSTCGRALPPGPDGGEQHKSWACLRCVPSPPGSCDCRLVAPPESPLPALGLCAVLPAAALALLRRATRKAPPAR